MNKHERRACASFLRKHACNHITLRSAKTEELLCTITLYPHLPPVTAVNTDKYPAITYGRSAAICSVDENVLILPHCLSRDVVFKTIRLVNGWAIHPSSMQSAYACGVVIHSRFCVKTDEALFPIADDLDTAYAFARMFRKFVGYDTVLVSRGSTLYAALKNKITFARQSGNQLVLDSRNTYRGQTLGQLFDELRSHNE